jgi:dTDP-glucose pyrophosphorylase
LIPLTSGLVGARRELFNYPRIPAESLPVRPHHRAPPRLQGACLEEITFRNGWMDQAQLQFSITAIEKTSYADYLQALWKKA